jgi:hypothetical protein
MLSQHCNVNFLSAHSSDLPLVERIDISSLIKTRKPMCCAKVPKLEDRHLSPASALLGFEWSEVWREKFEVELVGRCPAKTATPPRHPPHSAGQLMNRNYEAIPSSGETWSVLAAAHEYPLLGKNTTISSNQAIRRMRPLVRTMSQWTKG